MSVNTDRMNDAPPGSSEAWDNIWKGLSQGDATRKKVFTRGLPQTIHQFWQRAYFEDLMQIIQPRRDQRMLELASGRGTTSLYLAANGFTDITLLDLSSTALEQAAQNFQSEGLPTPTLVSGNALETKLPGASFDCIYNIGVLEHFEDPQPFLQETFRLLAPGGKIFMPIVPQMPFMNSLVCRALFNPVTILKKLVKVAIRFQQPADESMVRTVHDRHVYVRVARDAGFERVACIPYNPYWLINDDGWFLDRVVLPLYRAHHELKKMVGVRPAFKALGCNASCYLLTASKK